MEKRKRWVLSGRKGRERALLKKKEEQQQLPNYKKGKTESATPPAADFDERLQSQVGGKGEVEKVGETGQAAMGLRKIRQRSGEFTRTQKKTPPTLNPQRGPNVLESVKGKK